MLIAVQSNLFKERWGFIFVVITHGLDVNSCSIKTV